MGRSADLSKTNPPPKLSLDSHALPGMLEFCTIIHLQTYRPTDEIIPPPFHIARLFSCFVHA